MRSLILILLMISTFGLSQSEIRRDFMALYDSSETPEVDDYSQTYLHLKIESVFNHLGYKLEFVDIAKGLPKKLYSSTYMRKFKGVITWFNDSNIKNPEALINWLKRQVNARKKYITLGYLGYEYNEKGKPISLRTINSLLKLIGLEATDGSFDNPIMFEVLAKKENKLVEFERGLEGEILFVRHIKSIDESNDVWLKIGINEKTKRESDVVVISNNGAYAQYGFEMFINPIDYKTQWRINPFEFLKAAIKDKPFPIPDISLINGGRVYYSHIDGDGFINVSYIDRKSYCGEIIRDKVLKKYPLPVSVSIVVAEIDPNILGNERILKTARDIMALDNVEIASHTHSHPLSWNMMPTRTEVKTYFDNPKEYKGGQIVAYKIKNYKLNYWQEVVGSINWINKNLAPKGKENKVLFWSGSCKPPLEALKHLDETNMLNMNGGDGRFDEVHNSYSFLSALYKMVGKYRQIYTSNANENIYTNLWSGPYGGFREVVQTFKRTKEPFLIRPINIYYHFYSGEFISSLKALDIANEYSLSQKITPVFASDYVKTVHGWIDSKVIKISDNHFKLQNYGDLKTFRIDGSDKVPNYQLSKNIIGHYHYQGNLYLFLQNGTEAEFVLTNKSQLYGRVKSCNCIIDKRVRTGPKLEYQLSSRSDLKLVLSGLNRKSNYQILWKGNSVNLNSNSDGELSIELKDKGDFSLKVKDGSL